MIETKRLILRPFCAEDLDIIYRIYSDAEILRYAPYDCLDADGARAHLNKIIAWWQETPPMGQELAVVRREDGRKIGRCHVHVEHEESAAMIGWFLLQDSWGKGYATEMTASLLDYCFEELELHRVYALCHPENLASRRVLEKSGLRQEGHFVNKCKYVKSGVVFWEDELLYAKLASEHGKDKENGL